MEDFGNTLIDWYNSNKRDLPWRNTTDPYKIWISEIILQQTRVAQGLNYYLRFINRFPDVKALAQAKEDEVLKLWQGLGYYSRARNLHVAAQSMSGGGFPRTYKEVRALRGVGDYTAAAICSIAYGLPHAVVDGNVYRVLSRYFGIDTPIDSTAGKKEFAALAQELLNTKHPGLYNQAIMDFGALQCTPSAPDCSACPLGDSCVALAKGLISTLPVKQNKVKTRNRYFTYLYIKVGEYTFLNRRGGGDIWQGLYELPLIETDSPLEGEEQLLLHPDFQRYLNGDIPVSVRLVKKGIKHILSHQVLYVDFYEIVLSDDSHSFSTFLKVKTNDIDTYAVPKLIHSFFEFIRI